MHTRLPFVTCPAFIRLRAIAPAWRMAILILALLAAASRPASALTINPQFDSSITSDPNAATIEATIDEVIRTYEAMLSDPFTINVTFVESTTVSLGENSTPYQTDTYTDFLGKLTADQTTANDATALSHLPVQTDNPVNGNANVSLTVANEKALGIFANGAAAGTVYLNTSEMNLSRTGTQNPSNYDMFSVTEHELDELLGISSSLVNGSNGQPAPTGPINPIDLFRYDQVGNRSYTTSSNALSYLSIDGSTNLAQFNQISNSNNPGDFGDYNSFSGPFTPQVQDAYGTPGVILNLGAAEKTSLDVIGYNLLAPVTWDATATSGTNPADGAGTWANGGASNWSNGASDAPWTNSLTGVAQFGSTSSISGTACNVTLGTNIVAGTLTFANQAYTLSGSNSLTVGKSIISVASATINTAVILGGSNAWDTVGSSLLTVNGNVSGPYNLIKQGPGNLSLTGSNSFNGGTIIQEGILTVGSSRALPSGGNVTVSGGILELNGNAVSIGNLTFGDGVSSTAATFQDSASTRGSASLAGNITYNGTLVNSSSYFPAATLSANLVLQSGTHGITTPDNYIANNYDIVISGTMSGPGGIAKNGVNYVALTAANTYTGPTNINVGWLFLATANAIPSLSDVTVVSGGVLSLNPTNTQTGIVTGNYSQSVGSLSGNGQINLGSTTLAVGNDNNSTSFSGAIFGTGGLIKNGTGTFTISSAQSYTGATIINSGILQIYNTGSVSGAISGSSGATLIYNQSSNYAFANSISGGVGFTQAGTGDVFITGSNTYTGATTVSGSGYLVVGANSSTGSLGSGSVIDNTGVYLYRTNNFTMANAIGGTGFLEQQGSGIVTLTASSTYTGSTILYSGSIQLGNGAAAGTLSNSSAINGNSGTALIFDHSNNISFGNSTSGGMGLIQSGSGSLTLTAANGYTGPTTVTSGTLIVNGSITGSTTTVNGGGAIGGAGTLGPVTIQSGGFIAPSPGVGPGLLIAGNFSLATGATMSLQLDGTSGEDTAGTQYSQLSVDGSVTLAGNIQISLSNFTPVVGETFYGILNDGADVVSGAFANATGNILYSNGWEYSVNYAANGDGGSTANDVAFTVLAAVPEPSAIASLLAGAVMLVGVSRFRRKR